jgi:transcriptional regulator with XRE-family HTH domain
MMTGPQMEAARLSFGLARKDFGLLLGYGGELRNIYATVRRYELGTREIPPTIERLVRLLVWFKADHGYLPDLDAGERSAMEMPEVAENV